MLSSFVALATLLASAALATAHGWIRDASIGGKEYEFYNPDTDKYMPVTVRPTRPTLAAKELANSITARTYLPSHRR